MTWEAWATGITVLLMFGGLATGRYGADIIVVGALLTLIVLGIVSPAEGISGFASTEVATVALLYVVTAGLKETGGMAMLGGAWLEKSKTSLQAQTRMVVPVTIASAFMNNTPLVAMFMPVLSTLSKRSGIPASRLFLPLSYAAILGGVCTLIGTSTNLVVSGAILKHNQSLAEGEPRLVEWGMWTIAPAGIPVAIVGIAYVLLMGRKLLPARDGENTLGENARQYMLAMRVAPASSIVGKSVEEAGLRSLPGLFLSRIERSTETLIAVDPNERLAAGDILLFVGILDSVVDLQKIRGLEPVTDEAGGPIDYRPKLKLIEAVVSQGSPLVGGTIREAGIRSRYGAVVIAVHRYGQRLEGKLGDVILRPGDSLLLEASQGFARRYRDSTDFTLVSEVEGQATLRHERGTIALVILVAMVLAMSFFGVPSMVAAMAGAGLMILARCCTGPQARASVEWPVIIVIAASIGIGRAMQSTGLAQTIAHGLVGLVDGLGAHAVLAMVYAITLLFTATISNNAAAALMFPIALEASRAAGQDFTAYGVCIAIAASCQFSTPIGYQTNLMVLGPGGYKWMDYVRFGLPLDFICMVVGVAAASMVWPLT